MRKVNGFFLFSAVLLSLSLMMFLFSPVMAQQSTEARLVKIGPDYEGVKVKSFHIDPATVYVRQNTIVVWMNGVQDMEVQVVFDEGKTCRDVTANPNLKVPGFFLDSRSCYVTSFLPYAGTTTLQFVDVGTYKYKVVTADGKLKAEGKIVVSK